jgi:hypothetical protein
MSGSSASIRTLVTLMHLTASSLNMSGMAGCSTASLARVHRLGYGDLQYLVIAKVTLVSEIHPW